MGQQHGSCDAQYRLRAVAARRVPNLFIVGAPKSGTTSMYEYLRGHPDVFLTEFKEPCYFAPDLALDKSGNFLRYGRDEVRYYDLFSAAGNVKVVGEASTRYLFSSDAPVLIREASPEARIVAMLRNPVDLVHSLHAHKLAAGTEDIVDFEQALAAEDDRHAGRRLPAHSNPRLATYRDRALFGEQVSGWLQTFGRDRVHVIIFEDMASNPAAEFQRLLEFLDIDPDYEPASFSAHNVAHGARSARLRRLLSGRPAQWLGWTALPKIIGDSRTRTLVRRFSQGRLQRRPIERSPISPQLRSRLEQEFAPDVALLSRLLERDMSSFWFGRQGLPESDQPTRTMVAGASPFEGT
jgi:hypothetical protein